MEQRPTRFEALKLAMEAYGVQDAAAEALGVAQSTVSRWLSQSKQLPAEYVLRVEADTGISRHWLRPDIYGPGTPPASARFHGTDLHAGARPNGLDGRVGRVSFQRRAGMKGAAL